MSKKSHARKGGMEYIGLSQTKPHHHQLAIASNCKPRACSLPATGAGLDCSEERIGLLQRQMRGPNPLKPVSI